MEYRIVIDDRGLKPAQKEDLISILASLSFVGAKVSWDSGPEEKPAPPPVVMCAQLHCQAPAVYEVDQTPSCVNHLASMVTKHTNYEGQPESIIRPLAQRNPLSSAPTIDIMGELIRRGLKPAQNEDLITHLRELITAVRDEQSTSPSTPRGRRNLLLAADRAEAFLHQLDKAET